MGTRASGTGVLGTGASEIGASGTGASGTGVSGIGASRTGARCHPRPGARALVGPAGDAAARGPLPEPRAWARPRDHRMQTSSPPPSPSGSSRISALHCAQNLGCRFSEPPARVSPFLHGGLGSVNVPSVSPSPLAVSVEPPWLQELPGADSAILGMGAGLQADALWGLRAPTHCRSRSRTVRPSPWKARQRLELRG